MRGPLKMLGVISLLLILYVGTFSYWWLRSLVKVVMNGSRQVRVVTLAFSPPRPNERPGRPRAVTDARSGSAPDCTVQRDLCNLSPISLVRF